jgi:hypothetical protein
LFRIAGAMTGGATIGRVAVALSFGQGGGKLGTAEGVGGWPPVGAGDEVGVGVERAGSSVAITRGATGTGPSVSTGPCARGLAVGAAAGGSWKSRAF